MTPREAGDPRPAEESGEPAADEVAAASGVAPDVVALVRAAERIGADQQSAAALYQVYRRRPSRPSAEVDRDADLELRDGLRQANGGRGTWEPDWTYQGLEWSGLERSGLERSGLERSGLDRNGEVAVRRGGLTYSVDADRVRTEAGAPGDGSATPGSPCRVWVPAERQRLHAGFYLALGEADLAPADRLPCLVRLYWNLRPEGAVRWMAAITGALNRAGIPFRAKVASSHAGFDGADAAILYLEPDTLDRAWPSVVRLHRELADELRRETPLLTLPLARGLAAAEGPAAGDSFGHDRVRRVVAALRAVAVAEREAAAIGEAELERCRAVAEHFSRVGLDARRPHLCAASVAGELDLGWARRVGRGGFGEPAATDASPSPRRERTRRVAAGDDPSSPAEPTSAALRGPARGARRRAPERRERLLAEAVRLGDRLCGEAWWHRGRCNWVGRDAGERRRRGEVDGLVSALDAGLYRGSAGVGWFLAELHATTGDRRHRRTAIAALERSLDRVEAGLAVRTGLAGEAAPERSESVGPERAALSPALLVGPLGAIAAALVSAGRLDSRRLESRAERALAGWLEASSDDATAGVAPHRLDLFGGIAGGVVGVLGLLGSVPPALGRPALALARRWGQELVDRAEVRGHWWRWPNREVSGIAGDQPPLTGLSHGASGIALALLELHAATGEGLWRDAARGALAYEDSWFDPEERNWRDLRPLEDSGDAARFTTAWCHGAPGIALARLRAWRLDPSAGALHRDAAVAGLELTADRVRRRRRRRGDASLCHGLAGLAGVLGHGAAVLGEPRLEEAAMDAMADALEAPEDRRWPSGVASRGPEPSLFLGVAGVGATLLRLAADGEAARPFPLLQGRLER